MASNRDLEKFIEQHHEMLPLIHEMYAALQSTNATLQSTNATLQELVAQKDAEIARLNEIISHMKRALYGQKSEKTAYVLDGQPMLPFETPEPSPLNPEKVQNSQPEPVQITVQAHRRTKRTLEERFEALPVVEEVLDIPEDCKIGYDGCPLEPIGKEFVRSEIIRIPPKCYHKKIYRKTYVDRSWEAKTGETRIRKSAIPAPLIEKSYASASLVTGILIQKYVDGMPLYRMEQMYKREGLPLTRATMANWVIAVAELYLLTLYIRLCHELTQSTVIHADETPLQVLKEQARPATAQSRMWVYATSKRAKKQIRCFDYQETRSGDCAVQFLENFQGVLISDGYSGYNKLKNVTRAGCWAHLRRKWREAMPKGATIHNSLSAIGFDYCNKLFKLEESFEKLDDNERRHKRQTLAKPLLDEYWNWLENIGSVSGKLKDAVTYSKTQRKYLETFLEHGEIEISNNQVENAIRPFVIGRKGWLFSDTPRGAQASAVVYSIMETAKANGLNVNDYILYLLTEFPSLFQTGFVIDDYLPWAEGIQRQFRLK